MSQSCLLFKGIYPNPFISTPDNEKDKLELVEILDIAYYKKRKHGIDNIDVKYRVISCTVEKDFFKSSPLTPYGYIELLKSQSIDIKDKYDYLEGEVQISTGRYSQTDHLNDLNYFKLLSIIQQSLGIYPNNNNYIAMLSWLREACDDNGDDEKNNFTIGGSIRLGTKISNPYEKKDGEDSKEEKK